MNGERFDAMARVVAAMAPRRTVLRLLAGAAALAGRGPFAPLTGAACRHRGATCRRGRGRCCGGLRCCRGRCRDVRSTERFCGGCRTSCDEEEGQRCEDGRCVCPDARPACGEARLCCRGGETCNDAQTQCAGSCPVGGSCADRPDWPVCGRDGAGDCFCDTNQDDGEPACHKNIGLCPASGTCAGCPAGHDCVAAPCLCDESAVVCFLACGQLGELASAGAGSSPSLPRGR